MPATCSFTSCGCDHAKGVTRQMRTAEQPSSTSDAPPASERASDCGGERTRTTASAPTTDGGRDPVRVERTVGTICRAGRRARPVVDEQRAGCRARRARIPPRSAPTSATPRSSPRSRSRAEDARQHAPAGERRARGRARGTAAPGRGTGARGSRLRTGGSSRQFSKQEERGHGSGDRGLGAVASSRAARARRPPATTIGASKSRPRSPTKTSRTRVCVRDADAEEARLLLLACSRSAM